MASGQRWWSGGRDSCQAGEDRSFYIQHVLGWSQDLTEPAVAVSSPAPRTRNPVLDKNRNQSTRSRHQLSVQSGPSIFGALLTLGSVRFRQFGSSLRKDINGRLFDKILYPSGSRSAASCPGSRSPHDGTPPYRLSPLSKSRISISLHAAIQGLATNRPINPQTLYPIYPPPFPSLNSIVPKRLMYG
jgi:hypothetical protein